MKGLLPQCTKISTDGRVSDMVFSTEKGYYHDVDRWKSQWHGAYYRKGYYHDVDRWKSHWHGAYFGKGLLPMSIDGRVSDMVLITEKGYCYYHSQTVEGVPGTAPHSWQSNSQVQYCFTSIETIRTIRDRERGQDSHPARISHSSWALEAWPVKTSLSFMQKKAGEDLAPRV